jgi:hypothetical protein
MCRQPSCSQWPARWVSWRPDVEASRAFRFAVHFFANEEMMTESLVARVMAWMAEKRTAVNNDLRIVPGILGVAEPITVLTW